MRRSVLLSTSRQCWKTFVNQTGLRYAKNALYLSSVIFLMSKQTQYVLIFGIGVGVVLGVGLGTRYTLQQRFVASIASFSECIAAGFPVLESYPEQCITSQGNRFPQDIGNELEKQDLIILEQPRPQQLVESPLRVQGQARGFWYFEASFPVELLDANGSRLALGIAQAQGEWMTEDFVPFNFTFEFSEPTTPTGELLLRKDNPSGLAEFDDVLRVPVRFY